MDKSTEKILKKLKKYTKKYWGKRCEDYNAGCILCVVWEAVDSLEEVLVAPEDYAVFNKEPSKWEDDVDWVDKKVEEVKVEEVEKLVADTNSIFASLSLLREEIDFIEKELKLKPKKDNPDEPHHH
jgi:hypothetical protein